MRNNAHVHQMGAALIAALIFIVIFTAPVAAQKDVKTTLFEEADKSLAEARALQADVLGPKNFATALDYYNDAEKDFSKGKNIEIIRQNLNACVSHCKLATAAAMTAQTTLPHAIEARSDAIEAQASTYAEKAWTEAEEKFLVATRELEAGRTSGAQKRAGDAEALYRKAELSAIKESYLSDTWKLLQLADDADVKKFAPLTLTRAQQLLAESERELNENRYDTDAARSLAKEAKYEASHSLYLTATVKRLRDDKDLLEEHLLAAEAPLQQIADKLAIAAAFDQGSDQTTSEILESIIALQDSAAHLLQELADTKQQVELTTSRISELEAKLGGVEQEKSELAKTMEANEKVRAQFAAVEKIFDRDEANVFRKGNDINVRLIGLTFPVGKSIIESQNFAVLTKLQQAIRMFPNSKVEIEGHTDSHGGDAMNLKLSQERAEAVRQYLMANMGIDASSISAVGYGETKPTATNETIDGRAKNRRIDVVILLAL